MSNKLRGTYLVIIAIALIIYWYFLTVLKQKRKDLDEIERKISENEKLDTALKMRTQSVITYVRWVLSILFILMSVLIYFIFNRLEYVFNITASIGIFFTAFSFARFGTLDGFQKWWHYVEISIETFVYRKTPDLRLIIENDKKYKNELEKEIDDLNSIFNKEARPQTEEII